MDYKFLIIRRVVSITSLQAIHHQAPPPFPDTEHGHMGPGNHHKNSPRRSSLVACFVWLICVRFYWAYSPTTDESYEGKLEIYEVRTV